MRRSRTGKYSWLMKTSAVRGSLDRNNAFLTDEDVLALSMSLGDSKAESAREQDVMEKKGEAA